MNRNPKEENILDIDQRIVAWSKDKRRADAAFSLLFDTYAEKLYSQIRSALSSHEDSNDVLQNVLLKAWKGLEKFKGNSKLHTWLYRIAHNETMSFIARNKRQASHQAVDYEKTQYQQGAEDADSAEVIEKKLHFALGQLPEKQRMVFNYRYYENLPYEEISEITGTSKGALKASFHHAVKKIEEIICALD